MNRVVYIISLLLLCNICAAQIKGLKPKRSAKDSIATGTLRAVVVGVSDYQNDQIPDLQYAHIDAEIFAEYLLSSKSGITNPEHLKLLTNEHATAGNFIAALYWLIEESNPGDEAIIYFSGHGDVESNLLSQPGFLLCWDSPHKVYMSGGTFGLTYLKEIVATLSALKETKVTVITDACRSGALAGEENEGSQTTASYLSQQFANEAKIMSCQPNEFALESAEWGNGRGIFSYYLVKGLKGLADADDDGTINLKEIQRYLEDNVSAAAAPHNQNPMTVGDRLTTVALTDRKVEPKSTLDDNTNMIIASTRNNESSAYQDTVIQKLIHAFNLAINQKILLYPTNKSAWHILEQLKEYEEFDSNIGLYQRNLAAALQDEAQQSINKYLEANSQELMRRWQFDDGYTDYPEYLRKAMQLLGEDHFYYNELKARAYYYEGLKLRLKGEQNYDTLMIIKSMAYQDSCLQIDSLAAFAFNEKAYASFVCKDYDNAEKYYNSTLAITPKWTLAWSNLCDLYNTTNQFEKAIAIGKKAIEIDANNSLAHYNLSDAYENNGDDSLQLVHLNKAYESDSNFTLVLNKFAYLAYQKEDYITSEKYWNKSFSLDSSDVLVNNNLGHLYLTTNRLEKSKFHFENIRKYRPNALEAYQGMIEYYYYSGDVENAEIELLSYVNNFPKDGFAYYLLASIYASKNENSRSLTYMQEAFKAGFDQLELLNDDPNMKELILSEEYILLSQRYFKE